MRSDRSAVIPAGALAGLAIVAVGVAAQRRRRWESESRDQARQLARRAMREEGEVRRRVAEAIHDGPVQELIGLDMMLSAAGQALEQGNSKEASAMLADARELTERNVRSLRDEIVELGPHGFDEVSYEDAVRHCLDVWHRRYGLDVRMSVERMELPSELAGDLFRITQEAVLNAGRHAEAEVVSISLRSLDGQIELRVVDDGKGFGDEDPADKVGSGHLGLASIRERAALMGGRLEIETSGRGTKLVVLAPLRRQRLGWRDRSTR